MQDLVDPGLLAWMLATLLVASTLRAAGFLAMGGQIIDASIVACPK